MSKEHAMTETERAAWHLVLTTSAELLANNPDKPGPSPFHDHQVMARRLREMAEALTAWNTRPSVGEPVAWRYLFGSSPDGCWSYATTSPEPEWAEQCRQVQPLYTRPSVVPAELAPVEGDVSDDEADLARILCRRSDGLAPNDMISVNDGPLIKAWRYFVPRARAMLLASQEG